MTQKTINAIKHQHTSWVWCIICFRLLLWLRQHHNSENVEKGNGGGSSCSSRSANAFSVLGSSLDFRLDKHNETRLREHPFSSLPGQFVSPLVCLETKAWKVYSNLSCIKKKFRMKQQQLSQFASQPGLLFDSCCFLFTWVLHRYEIKRVSGRFFSFLLEPKHF